MNNNISVAPKDRIAGLRQNWRTDIVSGFIIFLIALPLCLGIALASNVPPIAGIISAIIGGIIVSQINGSYVTINGPAAGLIVVIYATVDRLGGGDMGYHALLAAVVIAGLFLFILGICKAGQLGEFFPATVIHGMLASIGVTIIAKQLPFVLGVSPPTKETLQLIFTIPKMLVNLNSEIAIIGGIGLAIMTLHHLTHYKLLKRIPAPIIVVAIGIVLGEYFNLPTKLLVTVPIQFMDGITHPNFSQIGRYAFWLSVISITLVQGIESLLSCAAIDMLDPYKRRANLSRDVAAVGLGSAISAMLGGLPMIAEIVRSSANIANGARTRWSNFFHGVFMLFCVVLATSLINKIPLASLAALLVFIGYQLISPRVFKLIHKIGSDQTSIFVITLMACLATDLLVGVFIGILSKFILHLFRGASLLQLFHANVNIHHRDHTYVVTVKDAAIFSNYLSLKRKLIKIPALMKVKLDLSQTRLVDHTVMQHLYHYAEEYRKTGGEFDIIGLDAHKAASSYPLATRWLKQQRMS